MKPGIAWPLGVVGVFFVSLSVCGTTVYLATSNPAVVTDEAYYEQAVRWDEISAERRASQALGWSLEVDASEDEIVVRMVNESDEFVEAGEYTMKLFPHASPGIRMTDSGPFNGAIRSDTSEVSFGKPVLGLWRLELRVTSGEDVFVQAVDFEIVAGERRTHVFDQSGAELSEADEG